MIKDHFTTCLLTSTSDFIPGPPELLPTLSSESGPVLLSCQYRTFSLTFAPRLACFSHFCISSALSGSSPCPPQIHELSPFPASVFSPFPNPSLFPIPVSHSSCSISLQLLCQNPLHRLRYLHHFQVHPFFRGVAFDPELLQKHPVNLVLEIQATQSSPSSESIFFKDFECNLESYLVHPNLA